MTRSTGYLLAEALIGICLLMSFCCAVGPPKQVGAYQAKQIAKVGQQKKRFDCPVSADPPDLLMIQWIKDGETISEGLWPRFRISKEGSLRIRDIMLEDAGLYVCKATNGFGSINVNFSLIVIDSATGQVEKGGLEKEYEDEEDPLKEGVPPYFIEEKKMQRKSIIVRPVESSARLRCRANGNPRPVVQWIKDGHSSLEPRSVTDMSEDDIHQSKWTLKLTNLQETDSGAYECVVSNKYGAINFTYSLEVIGKIKSKPLLIGPDPLNKTVSVGGTASFLCKVKSAVQPHIQWLKRLDKDSDMELNYSSIIKVKDQNLLVLKTDEVWEDSDGFFHNKIVIRNVLPMDVGMYICLAANSVGYSYRSAYLHLNYDNGDTYNPSSMADIHNIEPSGSLVSLPLIIAIPTIIIIILVIVAIYCLQRRNRCNSQNNSLRNTRFNAVPTHEREVYTPPVHTNPHMVPHMAPPGSRSSGEKMTKNHNIDFYSDISSVSRCHHQQPQQQPPPHQGIQYGY